MKLTKVSLLSGVENTMDIPGLDESHYYSWLNSDNSKLVQHAFPQLTANEREFIINGITPQEWREAFGDE